MGSDDENAVDVDGAARAVRSIRVRTGEGKGKSGGDRSRVGRAMGRVRGGMTRRMTVTESIALCATPHATVLAYRTLRDCGKRMDEATLGEAWEDSDEKPAIVTLGVYGFVGLVALNGTVRAVDSLPLIPFLLELVGILFSAFFVYQNLLYKPDRAALRETINKTLNKIL